MNLKGKKILVTGGAGFLGSFLVRKLKQKSALLTIPRSKDCNLVDITSVHNLFKSTDPDIVIHLAAHVGGIGANMMLPGTYFYENAMMGLLLIEEARRHGIEKFVAIGTICAYPKFTPVPFKEEELWNGYPEETNAPYGLAKKMMLVQIQAYQKQYGFKGIYLLPVNLYGPGDNFDLETSHVIPALIRKCMEAKQKGDKVLQVWGTGNASREFLYVEDCAEAILLATEKYGKSDPVNIGSGTEITIKELVVLIAKLTGFKGIIKYNPNKPDGQPRRCLDVSRAEKEFHFKASTSFEEGLKKTIEWYRHQM